MTLATNSKVTKAMLHELVTKQRQQLKQRDDEIERWKKAYVMLGEDYNELEEVSIKLSKRFIGFYNEYLKVHELNRELETEPRILAR